MLVQPPQQGRKQPVLHLLKWQTGILLVLAQPNSGLLISTDILLHVLDTAEQVHPMSYMFGTFFGSYGTKVAISLYNNQFESIGSINQLEKQAQKNI